MSRRALLRAGLRRLALLTVGVLAGTALVSVLGGLILDVRLSRALSLGFYLVGSFGLVAGFFVGNRGPARGRGPGGGLRGRRELRWAKPEEQEEALSTSVLLVVLGVVIVLVGLAVDPRARIL